MRLLSLTLLLALPLQEKGPRKLEWKLPKDRAAVFSFLDKSGKPLRDRDFVLLGSELAKNGNRLVVDRHADLALPFLFQLPAEPFKTNLPAWEHAATFFNDSSDATSLGLIGASGYKPLVAKGAFAVKRVEKKGNDEVATIDGSFTFYEIRRDFVNNQVTLTVTKNDLGTLATSVQVSLSRGMILKAGYQLKVRGQEREGARLVDRPLNFHEVLEFREETDHDPAKLRPSVEAAVKKAVDWLRKQQKPNGAWGTAASGVDIAATGLVTRALLASGVKADDPAIASAAKALRGSAAGDTWGLAQQILALAQKGPSKDEGDELRRLGDELLKRRDPRAPVWSAGGRNDSPNAVATGHALEALAQVPEARVPDEVWKGIFDLLTAALIEGDREIDLDIEFAKDAGTIEADPKKAPPGSWPAEFGRRGNDPFQLRGARRGSAFTLLSALKSLFLAAEHLKLDDKQKKALDGVLRKGFARLQAEWTLRTVPPVEGPWCPLRAEYLDLLSQVLARAKLEKVAGSDWRLDGSTLLLHEQAEDGSWSAADQPVPRTAHVLLFLSRVIR